MKRTGTVYFYCKRCRPVATEEVLSAARRARYARHYAKNKAAINARGRTRYANYREQMKAYAREYYREANKWRDDEPSFAVITQWAKYNIVRLRSSAKQRSLVFKIRVIDLISAFPRDFCCPVFGVPFDMTPRHQYGPSVDRLNPVKGYVPGNIAVISWRANAIKRDASLAELKAIVAWLDCKKRCRKPKS
jgi:hypothetical protein